MFISVVHCLFLVYVFIIKETNCLLCYSCKDLASNESCFNVTKCPAAEVCFGRADGFLTGDVKHTTGCTKELAPVKTSVQDATTFCSASCHGHLCNLDICSKANNQSSRPRCISCDYSVSPDDCTNVVLCSNDEMCYVSRFKAFGQVRYRLGCMAKQHCGKRINVGTIIGKRSTPRNCSVCCSSDHCNLNACYQNEHVGWGSWQSWSKCFATHCDNNGSKSRSRTCLSRLSITDQQPCVGSANENTLCYKHCPVNGGWCFRYELYQCSIADSGCVSSCSSGNPTCVRKVSTTCSCPEPKYGGNTC